MKSPRVGQGALALALIFLPVGSTGCKGTESSQPSVECETTPWAVTHHTWPSWNREGTSLVYMGNGLEETGARRYGLYMLDLRARKAVCLDSSEIVGLYGYRELDWAPDGNRIVVRTSLGISMFDLRDRSLSILFSPSFGFARSPAWRPGSEEVWFMQAVGRGNGLWRLELHTQRLTKFAYDDTGTVFSEEPVSFTRDGQRFVHSESVAGADGSFRPSEIFLEGADGRGRRQLTFLGGAARNPKWIRGDTEIIFDFVPRACLSLSDPVHHTWSVRPDGSRLHRWPYDLGDSRVQFGFPPAVDWSGKKVAFVALDEVKGYGVLHTMDIDGTNRRMVFK